MTSCCSNLCWRCRYPFKQLPGINKNMVSNTRWNMHLYFGELSCLKDRIPKRVWDEMSEILVEKVAVEDHWARPCPDSTPLKKGKLQAVNREFFVHKQKGKAPATCNPMRGERLRPIRTGTKVRVGRCGVRPRQIHVLGNAHLRIQRGEVPTHFSTWGILSAVRILTVRIGRKPLPHKHLQRQSPFKPASTPPEPVE